MISKIQNGPFPTENAGFSSKVNGQQCLPPAQQTYGSYFFINFHLLKTFGSIYSEL